MTDDVGGRPSREPHGESQPNQRVSAPLPTTRRTFVGLVTALSVGSAGVGTVASSTADQSGYGEGGFGEGGFGGVGSEPSVDDYADADGVVRTAGLREAIGDWRSGDVDTTLLRDVIDAWRTGEP